jgi:hypothetical protein
MVAFLKTKSEKFYAVNSYISNRMLPSKNEQKLQGPPVKIGEP